MTKIPVSVFGLIYLSFACVMPVAAQDNFCNMPSPPDSTIQEVMAVWSADHSIASAALRIRVHDVQAPDGTGNLTDEEISAILTNLREAFRGIVEFELVETIEEVLDPYDRPYQYFQEFLVFDDFNTPDAIDIVLFHPDHAPNYAIADYRSGKLPSTALALSGPNVCEPKVIAHEMGHCLGLWHTDEEQFGIESPDGTNCESAGDCICDTPAQPPGAYLFSYLDLETCTYVPALYEHYWGYHPDPTNLMTNGEDTRPICLGGFTPGQVDVMLSQIQHSPELDSVLYRVGTSYWDRSLDNSGVRMMPYEGLPYSSTTVDFDRVGPRDIIVSLVNERAQVYTASNLALDGGVPEYREDQGAFGTGSEPERLLGIAVADVNGDGTEELFGASQAAPRLYELHGEVYVDRAATWGVSTAAGLSTVGAWADYDCDGDVDLMVGTADCGSFEPGSYNVGPAVADVLLRNDLNTSGAFCDVSVEAGLQPGYYSSTTTVTWGDINDDGFPDIFIGEFGEPALGPPHGIDCRLFVNQRNGTFVDEADSLIGPHMAVFTIASVWRDMDNDGDLDIELANRTNRESLRYAPDAGLVSCSITEEGGSYSGLRVYDYDLDGLDDIILLPGEADEVPRLLAATGIGPSITYANIAAAAGIGNQGKVGGAVTADLNGDGDIDLFLGREPATDVGGNYLRGDQYLFQAKSGDWTSDTPANHWFSIKLQSSSLMNNRMGIGAKVTVNEVGQKRVRLVDGGSGRGGQDAPTMVFGLGSATSVESVTIDWPNGYRQVVPGTSLNISTGPGVNGANVIEDASSFSSPMCVVAGRVEVVPQSQLIDWIFTWTTDLKTNPDLDEIVFDTTGMSWECQEGLVPLNKATPDVEIAASFLADGRMQHQLTWRNRPCVPNCTLKFRAHSWINTNEGVSGLGQRAVKFCQSN